ELSLQPGNVTWQLNDLSARTGAIQAQGDPAGYRRSDFVSSVVYRGFDGHIHELWSVVGPPFWHVADLSAAVGSWPPDAAGDPAAYVRVDGANSVVYRGIDSFIHELFLPSQGKAWQSGDLGEVGTPLAVGVPAAYVRSDNVNAVLYRGADNHIYEF